MYTNHIVTTMTKASSGILPEKPMKHIIKNKNNYSETKIYPFFYFRLQWAAPTVARRRFSERKVSYKAKALLR